MMPDLSVHGDRIGRGQLGVQHLRIQQKREKKSKNVSSAAWTTSKEDKDESSNHLPDPVSVHLDWDIVIGPGHN
jgi:hypothetical protein